jgi:hypothetical protein
LLDEIPRENMGNIVNLRCTRKEKALAAASKEAAASRTKYGRTRARRDAVDQACGLEEKRLEGHRREPRLLGIGKRGNCYLRKNPMHGARAVPPCLVERETLLARRARAQEPCRRCAGQQACAVLAHGCAYDAGYEMVSA